MVDGKATGLGVDASGNPVIDPTANVIALTEAANKRQDDLRAAYTELSDTKIAHQKEIGELRALHQRELRGAESARLDSIRQVDREDANQKAALAMRAIETLAATTTTMAETLRAQQQQQQEQIVKRLSALELTSSASGAGSAGEKSGRISQQELIKYLVYLALAAIAIAAYLKKG